MRGTASDPVMADMVARVAETNDVAERSPGFVWRLPGSQITADELRVFEDYVAPFDAAALFYNLSVWTSVESLRAYAFESSHREVLQGRRQWIEPSTRPQMVMWWIPADHRPTVAESAERFRALDAQGPSPFAFSFQRSFPAPE